MIICEQSNIDAKKVKETVAYHLEEKECHSGDVSKIVILPSEEGRKTHDIIREYLLASVEEKYVDFIVVGNKGADFSSGDKNKYLGSVANSVLRNTKINTLFFP